MVDAPDSRSTDPGAGSAAAPRPRLARALPIVFFAALGFLAFTGVFVPGLHHAFFGGDRADALPVLAAAPEFALEDTSGGIVDRGALDGRVWVVDFIFTTCAGTCPVMSAQMRRLQDIVRQFPPSKRDRVRLLSVSVDPDQDTPPRLREYAELHGADPALWRFVRGSSAQVQQLARALLLPEPIAGASDGAERIIHSNRFVILDKQARVRGFRDGTDPEEMPRLLEDIDRLLAERR